MSEWKDINAHLDELSTKHLKRLIHDLYKTNDGNRKFLGAKFLKDKGAIKKYKDQIREAIYPDYNYGDGRVRFSDAKKAISDFEKATHDSQQTLDLMVYFLEVGTDAMDSFGMDYEGFYNSMESMFRKVCVRLKGKDKELLPVFSARIQRLDRRSLNTGYGYGDAVEDLVDDLVRVQDGKSHA